MAVLTGFEPATSGLTGRRALQTAPQDRGLSNFQFCTPNGIRTRVTGVKGRRPRPLDDGGSYPDKAEHDSSGAAFISLGRKMTSLIILFFSNLNLPCH